MNTVTGLIKLSPDWFIEHHKCSPGYQVEDIKCHQPCFQRSAVFISSLLKVTRSISSKAHHPAVLAAAGAQGGAKRFGTQAEQSQDPAFPPMHV